MNSTEPTLAAPIAAIRRFNRFYTRHIGILREGYGDVLFSLTEVRVLYEIAHRDGLTATDLARELGVDPGYLRRILRGFEQRSLIEMTRSGNDGRESQLRLSATGRAAFTRLDALADGEIAALVSRVARDDHRKLTDAMRTIERVLAPSGFAERSFVIRTHQPGDISWVVYRHGVLYTREHGWDERFEALVAQIAAEFVQNFDPRRERCWIAEQEGERVGSVVLVRKSDEVGQLRLFLVEPKARGLGIGQGLVDECIHFARQSRYQRVTLETDSILQSARRIYEAAGFRLMSEERHSRFGKEQTGETWELDLR